MNVFYRRAFWLNLAGACVVAIVAAVPLLMSNVMHRGFDISKQSLAEPLAALAFGAVLLGAGWGWIMQRGAATKIAAGALIAFLLLAVISAALSENPEVAVFGGFYRREGLLAWSAYGAFFFAVLGWAQHAGRVRDFLDVLLLSSVIAASYALQQRLGLDFYPLGARDLTRPSGTLGNPLFLAAYLAILLPLTAARCWQARHAGWLELAPWVLVGTLQVCGILVTQSRGPLLAATMGLLLLAACHAGRVHARRVFAAAFILFAAIAASIVAINTLPAARLWAQDVPVAARLVFSLDRAAAGEQTERASRSAASRLAVWEAGAETFSAAPLNNKLLGYGPESASAYYFPHIPASLMSLVGYGHKNMFERMHADTLEIGLNFGLLAWLVYCLFFGSVMYAAARALWDLSGSAPAWIFFIFMCAGGAISCAAAVQAGFSSAAAPAFGLGVSAGWFLFMLGCAWRSLRRSTPARPGGQAEHWILLAALTSSLWIFWVDAQINIPVPTTRLISFGIAALILFIADGIVRAAATGAERKSPLADWRMWGAACALVAACASWLPIIVFDAGAREMQWSRRALPILVFLIIAALVAWGHARRAGGFGKATARAWLAIGVGLPLLYAAGHRAVMIWPETELTVNDVALVSIAAYAGAIFIFAMCLAAALSAARNSSSMPQLAPFISRAARWSIAPVLAAAFLVAVTGWHARQADVASMLAARVFVSQTEVAGQLLEAAVGLQPHEREFRRQLVFDRLDRAVTDMRKINEAARPPADAANRIRAIVQHLAGAETAARHAVVLFPRDPWAIVALANVLQIKAMRVLRPLYPETGAPASQEAAQLFSQAHGIFPAEPLVLRNWAQLLADQGDLPAAYRLLDRMEKRIPNDAEPYIVRLRISRQVDDIKTISDTVARARLVLEPHDLKRVLHVANLQRN